MSALSHIQPIVLVGGRSRRFGRDKLRESMRDYGQVVLMVDQPIGALREVFGTRVAVVGECHEAVAQRADLVIEDHYPGIGPIGGIVSALEQSEGDVFVLPGDLPWVTADAVRSIVDTAANCPEAMAVLASSDRLEPCIGVYRQSALAILRNRIACEQRRLHDALPDDRVVRVPMDAAVIANVNTQDALRLGQTGGHV